MHVSGGQPRSESGEGNTGNRRKSGRVPCDAARCQFGAVMDLSRAGCRVIAKKPIELPAGATVNLKLENHGVKLTVPGRPASNRKRADGRIEIGFEFVITGPEMAQDLVDFLRVCLANHHLARRSA